MTFNHNKSSKFYSDEYRVNLPTYKGEESTIVVASDIHFHEHVDKGLFLSMIRYCNRVNADYVIMPGDLIESFDFLNNSKEKTFFEYIIRELASFSKVIITLGNHEMNDLGLKKSKNNCDMIKYFDSLNRIKNVYFLNNEQVQIDKINFLGFSPRYETYLKYNDQVREMIANDYIKSNLKMERNNFNLLVTHNPLLLKDAWVYDIISDFREYTDLVITGHIHDAYMPKCLDKYFENTNCGFFITPFINPFVGGICRGIHDFGRGYLFVSQGFRKYTSDNLLFNFFETFTANDLEKLNLEGNVEEKGFSYKKDFKIK